MCILFPREQYWLSGSKKNFRYYNSLWSLNRYSTFVVLQFHWGWGPVRKKSQVSVGADENEKEVEKHCFRDAAGMWPLNVSFACISFSDPRPTTSYTLQNWGDDTVGLWEPNRSFKRETARRGFQQPASWCLSFNQLLQCWNVNPGFPSCPN